MERSEKVKVVLLDGPFATQDVYVDQTAIVDEFVLIKGEPYELVKNCNMCGEAFYFRWRGNQ